MEREDSVQEVRTHHKSTYFNVASKPTSLKLFPETWQVARPKNQRRSLITPKWWFAADGETKTAVNDENK